MEGANFSDGCWTDQAGGRLRSYSRRYRPPIHNRPIAEPPLILEFALHMSDWSFEGAGKIRTHGVAEIETFASPHDRPDTIADTPYQMDAPIRTLIVDDEPTAREVLSRYVERHATLETVSTCESAVEAANMLRERDVDLLLLDVEMPEMSGLELVRAVEDPPAVILVTASETYAVEAFGLGIVDYLVKPVRYARFLKAVTRVENQQLGQSGSAAPLSSSQEKASAMSSQADADRPDSNTLFFQEEGDLTRVRLAEVQYVEAEGDYMFIRTESSKHMVNTTMKKIEAKFPSDEFARVHRSYLVRLDQIDKIEDDTVLLGDTRVPIGPTYRERLLEKIQTL